MLLGYVYGLLGLVGVAYLAEYLFTAQDDSREPRRLRAKVPLIGHILGFIRSGPHYHKTLQNATESEIYTLGIFNFKLYTAVSTRLLPLIQRQSKTLSFRPLVQLAARRWGDSSDATHAIFGDMRVLAEFSQIMKLSLAPGPSLDDMNQRMGARVLVELDDLLDEAPKQVWMLAWARHAVTQASSCGVYGMQHPFTDLEVENAFWEWHSHLSQHLTGLDFDVFKTGYAARQKVFDAHLKYYSKGVPQDAALLLTEGIRIRREVGISESDTIKQISTLPIGMLSNTVPTFYWTIWELFSRPENLAEIREEVETQAVIKEGDGFALDVGALKVKCPLLLSFFQETQRVHHIQASIRKVLDDTVLDGKYLLKAGNFIQVPGYLIHSNTNIWGPSASEFDPHRFVNPATKRGGSDFMAWGAAPHLCPARQFASTEILMLIALMVLRADLQPASGKWDKNPSLEINDPITVLNPKKDVLFDVKARKEWAGKWTLLTSESKVRVPLASG